jgi:ABC-2 type transport system permease protein
MTASARFPGSKWNAVAVGKADPMTAPMRLRGLAKKEVKQIVRDPSAILIAFLMPVILLIVNGFGINFDANHMKVAVVIATPGETEHGLLQALAASPYLDPIAFRDVPAAEAALIKGDVRGMLILKDDFTQRLARPTRWPAPAELAINATDPNSARILEGYVSGALNTWLTGQATEHRLTPPGTIDLQHRYWFNPELRSADAVVPGIIAMVMTMTGTLLTALIVAREWERGTMESMLASPAAMSEIICAKLGCYFVLGMGSMAMSVLMAIGLFGLPFRGGAPALAAAAALFLVFALGLGLFISTLARNQFIAAQVAFITTMLPAMMLSGMLFDIASMPPWLQLITYVVPARYLVSILQTLFLAGNVWSVVLPNLLGLATAAAIAVSATFLVTRRRLD